MAQSPSGSAIWSVLIDAAGNQWRLQYGGPGVGMQCVRNDVVDASTHLVVRGWIDSAGNFNQQNTQGGVWYWSANAWVQSVPQQPPTPVVVPPTPTPVPQPTPQPAPTFINGSINFGQTRSMLPASAFGWSSGALFDNSGQRLGDGNFIASAAKCRPAAFRVHCGYNMASNAAMQQAWLQSSPQWLDPNAAVMMGVGPAGNDTSVSAGQRASDAAALAVALRNAGRECFLWEVGNECDSMPVATFAQYFSAIRVALRNVNPAYKVGGPASSWWGSMNIGQLVAAIGAANLDFFSFHTYPVNATDSMATLYGKAAGFGDLASARSSLRQAGVADSVPIWITEYNQNGGAGPDGVYGLKTQTSYVGALYAALLLAACAADPTFGGATVWEAIGDSYYGMIGAAPGYDNTQLVPAAAYLRAGKLLAGRIVATSCSLSNLSVLATVSGKAFALQVVNYDQANAQTFSPVIGGASIASMSARFDLGKSMPMGQSASNPTFPLTVASESICLVIGALQ